MENGREWNSNSSDAQASELLINLISRSRKMATTECEKRAILQEASNSTLHARKTDERTTVKPHVKNVRRILYRARYLKRLKSRKAPILT